MTDAAEESAYRGSQAESELRETEQAFADVRAGLLEGIAGSALGDTEFRELSFKALFVLEAVRARLIAVAAGRAMAESDDLIRRIMAGGDQA